jgi:hypothetical protein
VTGTLFFRTRLHNNTVDDAELYLAVLFFTLTAMLFNNWAEFAIVSERLSLFYKQVCCFDGSHQGQNRRTCKPNLVCCMVQPRPSHAWQQG